MKKVREPGYVPTPLELFITIAKRTLLAYLVLATIGGVIAALTSQIEHTWGFLLGVGIAGVAMGITLLVMMITERVAGINDMAALLGSYLIKMGVLFVVFMNLRGFDFFNGMALLLGFAAAIVFSLFVNTLTIARSRT